VTVALCGLGNQAVRVDHELLGGAGVELLVTVGRVGVITVAVTALAI
jgi:hypothetical protein